MSELKGKEHEGHVLKVASEKKSVINNYDEGKIGHFSSDEEQQNLNEFASEMYEISKANGYNPTIITQRLDDFK